MVEFFLRALGEAKIEKGADFWIVGIGEEECFEFGVVDVAVGADGVVELGITGGPEGRVEIPDVEEFLGADGTTGIAAVVGADIGVTFAFEENGVAPL